MSNFAIYGKKKAIIYDIHDPKMIGRIRVKCPDVYGESLSDWCMPCFMPNSFPPISEGDVVYIEFENGDPAYPIWCGWIPKGAGSSTQAPFQKVHDVMKDDRGNIVDLDYLSHKGKVGDTEEHKKYHDHNKGKYYSPHRWGFRTPIDWGRVFGFNEVEVSDDPSNSYIRFKDMKGQYVELNGAKKTVTVKGFKIVLESANVEVKGNLSVTGKYPCKA